MYKYHITSGSRLQWFQLGSKVIVRFVDIGGIGLNFILKNRYLGIVRFVDIGGIGAHHCLNFIYWDMIVRFVDIGGINDNHCLNFLFHYFPSIICCSP